MHACTHTHTYTHRVPSKKLIERLGLDDNLDTTAKQVVMV